MIRILHCIETIASGGVEQTILTLIRGLDKTKFEHRILCTWKGGPVAEALEEEGVEITALGSFQHPFEWGKLKKAVKISRVYKPHIIHGAVFEGMTMATAAGIFNKKSIVILEETSDPQNRSKKANLLLKAFSWRADAFQAISNEVADYLVVTTKISPKKVRVILNGVEIPEALSKEEILKLRKIYKIPEDDFVVGFVGRLHNDHKRFTDLLEGLSLLNKKNIKLLVVGDGKDLCLLDSEIKRLKLMDQVIHVGYQANPHRFYDIMNVLCVPSSREGFGLVAVEGMLHHLPVIATAVGGLKGVVENGVTGFLIPPFSPSEISSAILKTYNQPNLIKRMGELGYQKALDQFTAKPYVKNIEDLYLSLLATRTINFTQ